MKLYRPTENTLFHIDYTWFDKNGQDVNVLIRKCLTPEQLDVLDDTPNTAFDFVNAETGEVTQATRVMQLIQDTRAKDPDFITQRLPVAEAVFRCFLLNHNQPLTPIELAAKINRKPSEILNQIGGRIVYNGIRAI
jgi:hypothetical protein